MANEWQPIENAPRNGQRVLVACPSGFVAVAFWNVSPRKWEGTESPCWTVFEPEDFFYAEHLDEDQPTYWMPLPEPPSA